MTNNLNIVIKNQVKNIQTVIKRNSKTKHQKNYKNFRKENNTSFITMQIQSFNAPDF